MHYCSTYHDIFNCWIRIAPNDGVITKYNIQKNVTESGNVHICCPLQTSVGTKWVEVKAECPCTSHWGVGGSGVRVPTLPKLYIIGVNDKPRGKAALLNKRLLPVPLNRKRRGPWGRSGHFEKQQNILHLPGIELRFPRCPFHFLVIIPTAGLSTTDPTLIGVWLNPGLCCESDD
jgi:hypothetical protein